MNACLYPWMALIGLTIAAACGHQESEEGTPAVKEPARAPAEAKPSPERPSVETTPTREPGKIDGSQPGVQQADARQPGDAEVVAGQPGVAQVDGVQPGVAQVDGVQPGVAQVDGVQPDVPKVYVKSRFVWVWPEPASRKDWIGFLWTGAAVPLKSTTPIPGPGCKAYYEIQPQGFVCADGTRATLDPEDPAYQAVLPYAPKVSSPNPHRYGESIGLVRYFQAPTPEHQRKRENDLTSHLRDVDAARAGPVPKRLAAVDLSLPTAEGFVFPELPRTVFDDRRYLKPRSTVAFSTEARFGDRGFLLTADYTWVPKDRVKPYPEIEFRGLRLGVDAKLPLAFFRKKDRPMYARSEDGSFEATSRVFPRLSHVELTGRKERWKDHRYLETREPGVWLREIDASVPNPRSKTPWGAPLDQEDTTGRAPKGGRGTWIEISIEGGWLLAFEGTRAVYATLMSPGRGGAARPDTDPLDTSASPVGVYPISGKLITATMVAPGELVHSDVPFAQNIVGPYALHGAYWHDNWGNPQSGGCINLAPTDAKWMFDFTEPKVPEGWHAVRWLPWQGPATIVILHR